jgi:alcohol dehydrogenase
VGPFDYVSRTRLVFGEGSLGRLGTLARDLGFRRSLLVADPGLVATGQVARARGLLEEAGIAAATFHDFDHDPDSDMVARGTAAARAADADSLVALGGGSSLDCAKGIGFLRAGGGDMEEYRGYGKARGPMLPMIGVPTTAGTGSEAQSYALISHPRTHAKMACGDPGAAFRVALLDPLLTVSQPAGVTATAGYDAISHAVEASATTAGHVVSRMYAREGWRLLEAHFERVLRDPADVEARAAMQLGAFLAGAAIEQSMLGATHACANPLSARYGTPHGVAIGVFLPRVVGWNAGAAGDVYADLMRTAGRPGGARELAERLEELARAAGLPRRLRDLGVREEDVPALTDDAAGQWTGRYNPRPFDAAAARQLYAEAF